MARPAAQLKTTDLPTPLGDVRLVFETGILCGLAFIDGWEGLERFLRRRFGRVEFGTGADGEGARERVAAYFSGDLSALDAIDADPGGSPFQQRVWRALRRIEVGRTWSYRELAAEVGSPTGPRAVAGANAANPIPVVIPCHRVIHADGSLSGYGGGVERKRWLLRHEAAAGGFRLTAPKAARSSRRPV